MNKNRKMSKSRQVRREQPRKDNNTKRENFDNVRMDKFIKDLKKEGFEVGKPNAITWYSKDENLLKAAASISFSTTTGLLLESEANEATPGVMQITWAPCLGTGACISTPNPTSAQLQNTRLTAVNQAANITYSYLVHANSRTTRYDAPDAMMFIMAGAQVYSFLALGIRAYGTMREFDQRNAYTPEALINAMGFNYSDLRNNLNQMWFDINEIVDRVSQLWIPNEFPFIERWFWLNSNIYKDADSDRAQFYVFTPKMTLQLSETGEKFGTSLIPTTWDANATGGNTWAAYKSVLNGMIDALVASQDRGYIFGDILNAYGKDKLYTVASITPEYKVQPVYDQEVLMQIENSTSFQLLNNGIKQTDTGIIYQDFSNNTTNAATPNGTWINPGNGILNFHTINDQPTPEMVMIATRLRTNGWFWSGTKTAPTGVAPTQCGTEYVFGYRIFYNTNKGLSNIGYRTTSLGDIDSTTTHTASQMTIIAQWSTFDWAPWLYTFTQSGIDAVNTSITTNCPFYRAYGDYDVYTQIDPLTLAKIHRTAIYSEFGVPSSL